MSTAHLPLAGLVPGGMELVLILLIVLLFFGGAKLPQLAKGMGEAVREFKKASKDEPESEKKPEAKPAAESASDASKLRNN